MLDFGVSMCVTVRAGVHADTHTHAWMENGLLHTH